MNGQNPNIPGGQNNLNNGINSGLNNAGQIPNATTLGGINQANTLGTIQNGNQTQGGQPPLTQQVPPVAPTQSVPPVNPANSTNGVNQTQTINPTVTPVSQTPTQAQPVSNSTIVNPTGAPASVTPQVPNSGMATQPTPSVASPDNQNNGSVSNVGLDPMLNMNSNGFVETPKVENIGTVPPPVEPKKKSMNKVVFIILVVVLIAAVAYGVYYFLSMSKKSKITVTTKSGLTSPLGEILPTDAKYYADITGTSGTNCSVNTLNVDTTKVGEYEYSISCGSEEFKGKISIIDNAAPTVNLKPVFAKTGDTIAAKDFIVNCDDASKCNAEFVNESTVNNNLSTPGTYKVDIKVSDDNNNTITVQSELYVVAYDILNYLACNSNSENLNDYKASRTITDKLAIGNNGTQVGYLDAGRREYKYVFTDEDEYKKVTSDKNATISFDGFTGLATYDDSNLTLTISADLNKDTLNHDAGGAFPSDYQSIRALYEETKQYTCQVVNQ